MKKKLLYILLVSLGLTACKKNPFDYRSKYLGDYEFTTTISSWNMISGVQPTETTVYNGSVSMSSLEGKIRINYMDGISTDVEVDREGNLSYPGSGKISKKTLSLEMTNGSGGGSSTTSISGKKKKRF
jgi:hypothetical protein